MTKKEMIVKIIENMDNMALYSLHNGLCIDYQYKDCSVNEMCWFNDEFIGYTPLEIAEKISDSVNTFDPYQAYYQWDNFGRLHSANRVIDLINSEEMAKFMVEENYSGDSKEIERILNDSDLED